ncbi:MAG TPA: pirin family protein [Polyangiaceae bacterium]|nr:pirin family protein [Polyangiaceae bacterium]
MSEVSRREALKLIAAAVSIESCTKQSREPEPEREAEYPGTAGEAVLSVAPLQPQWQTKDPFLFCVHHDDLYPQANDRFGPAASLEGRRMGSDFEGKDGWRMYHGRAVPGFPSHPHRGFETVTVVRRGLLDHSDSLGAAARYGHGDVQWLTAGSGIQHAEMFPLLERDKQNPVELFQIWLNLPSSNKMAEPHFSMLWKDAIPTSTVTDEQGRATQVTIVAGRYKDKQAPNPPPNSYASMSGSDVAIWTIKMAPGARFTLPATERETNRSLYFFRGSTLRVGAREIPPRHIVELRGDAAPVLQNGPDECELLMLQGRPIGEPVAQQGPFVMNTREEIRQAYTDFQRTRFGGWPWDSNDPVHGREGRFARHVSGKVERPT